MMNDLLAFKLYTSPKSSTDCRTMAFLGEHPGLSTTLSLVFHPPFNAFTIGRSSPRRCKYSWTEGNFRNGREIISCYEHAAHFTASELGGGSTDSTVLLSHLVLRALRVQLLRHDSRHGDCLGARGGDANPAWLQVGV